MNLGIPLKANHRGWLIGFIPSFPAENQQDKGSLQGSRFHDGTLVCHGHRALAFPATIAGHHGQLGAFRLQIAAIRNQEAASMKH